MKAARSFAPVMLSFGWVLACAASGCSSETEAPPAEPVTATSPALPEPAPGPAPAPSEDTTPLPTMPLTPSPSCGVAGARVVLRLGWTSDKRVPQCVRTEDFDVRFGATKAAVTTMGMTSDGYCALDVLVPAKAITGDMVKVTTGRDVFESPSAFAVPCQ